MIPALQWRTLACRVRQARSPGSASGPAFAPVVEMPGPTILNERIIPMRLMMLAAVALTALGTAPAVAQGCGMTGQGASAAGGGMMCSRPMATQAQVTAPQPGQQTSSGCACCRKMAMMQHPMPVMQPIPGMQQPAPGTQPSMPGMQHQMPGMPDMPEDPPSPNVPQTPRPQ